jgi:hypothetical protein
MASTKPIERIHNQNAPYWAVFLVIICLAGLSTNWLNLGTFWKGYVLDITGPAWCYILFRGLYTYYAENKWTRFFTPSKTFAICVFACFAIETAQLLNLYDSTYDPWDFLAYLSLLTPVFLTDLRQKKLSNGKRI